MKFETAYQVLKGIPFISEENAKELYDFIIKNELRDCLELGFAHGVASCYIAAAIDELGGGKLTSVDLLETP
jgi:predicted O-methyltransferase YrrM